MDPETGGPKNMQTLQIRIQIPNTALNNVFWFHSVLQVGRVYISPSKAPSLIVAFLVTYGDAEKENEKEKAKVFCDF
jgi:hypothetical protein